MNIIKLTIVFLFFKSSAAFADLRVNDDQLECLLPRKGVTMTFYCEKGIPNINMLYEEALNLSSSQCILSINYDREYTLSNYDGGEDYFLFKNLTLVEEFEMNVEQDTSCGRGISGGADCASLETDKGYKVILRSLVSTFGAIRMNIRHDFSPIISPGILYSVNLSDTNPRVQSGSLQINGKDLPIIGKRAKDIRGERFFGLSGLLHSIDIAIKDDRPAFTCK